MKKRAIKMLCLALTTAALVSFSLTAVAASTTAGGGSWENGGVHKDGTAWNIPLRDAALVGITGNAAAIARFSYFYDSAAKPFNADYAGTTSEKTVKINGEDAKIKYAESRQMDGKFEAYLDPIDNKWKTSFAKEDETVGETTTAVEVYGTGTLAERKANAAAIKANLTTALTNNRFAGALDGVFGLQRDFAGSAYVLPVKPSRSQALRVSDLKEFNDDGPEVTFGAEFVPGNQFDAYRGGYDAMKFYDTKQKKVVSISVDGFAGLSAAVDSYLSKLPAETDPAKVETNKQAILDGVAQARTWGGADYMLAKLGGAWDTMLSEGRRFWAFGAAGDSFVKNYTYAYGKDAQSVLDGMRSGNSFVSTGDLITALDYTAANNGVSATMGETIIPVKGKDTTVTITFTSPNKNVDHIDLIAGEVGEKPVRYADGSTSTISVFTDPTQYLTPAYQTDTVDTTKVIKTFNKSDFKVNADGSYTVTFTLPAGDKDMYYRLRGTNNAKGSANCDTQGNPTVDSLLGDNTEAKAKADLWFYSNPVFVSKQVADGVSVSGTIKKADGSALANRSVILNEQITRTDAQGNYNFSNIEVGKDVLQVLAVLNAAGEAEEYLAFKVQRGGNTEFDKGDIWLADSVYALELDLMIGGADIMITAVKGAAPPVNNPGGSTTNAAGTTAAPGSPKTGEADMVIYAAAFALVCAALSVMIFKSTPKYAKEDK
ncbi:MAG: hypothetical protein FWE80_00550 [Oscillospiraceae bacterium]|nr:hypothetical protein [Oscillospiraceae bacterium]